MAAVLSGGVSCRMSGDDMNPAAVAQPVKDLQGDGRWMSQVCVVLIQVGNSSLSTYCIKILH